MEKDKTHELQIKDTSQGLTGALYRVTDFLSDRDPIKWTLRELSMRVHTHALVIAKNPYIMDELLSDIDELLSVLIVGAQGAYLSNRNFSILGAEYKKFYDALEGTREDILSDMQLSFSFGQEMPKIEGPNVRNNINNMSDKRVDTPKKKATIRKRVVSTQDRKPLILALLSDGTQRTVREIATHFSDVGEKSIQRDLLTLVKNEQIVSQGEKRWRTYVTRI